jgi:hypothetical protein
MVHRLVVATSDVVTAVAHLGPQTALIRAYRLAAIARYPPERRAAGPDRSRCCTGGSRRAPLRRCAVARGFQLVGRVRDRYRYDGRIVLGQSEFRARLRWTAILEQQRILAAERLAPAPFPITAGLRPVTRAILRPVGKPALARPVSPEWSGASPRCHVTVSTAALQLAAMRDFRLSPSGFGG